MKTEDAVGQVLCHDITQIIKGVTKDAIFRKGHVIQEEDIPVLLSVGKDYIYIWENDENMLHENDAAEILRQICQGEHMHPTEPKEGKIELIADRRCDIRYSEVRSQSNEMLEDAKNDYLEAEVTARNELAEAEQELLENEKKYEEDNAILEENLILVQNAEANLPLYRQQVADGERELNKAKEDLAELEAEVKTAEEQYEAYINDPNKTEEQKQNAKDSLLLAQGMYELSSKALESKEEELNQAKKDLADLEYAVANKNELIAGSEKLQKAKEELERGREKFEIAKQDAEAELEDAKVRLAEAEREINSMQIPVWYVLNRDAVESYMSFKNDTQSIGAIGTVFPIIFFLVAALVALTTMTRMVEEQRTQIGTLKALGYSKFTIIGKYILYAGLATVIGSVVGVFLGEFTIPYFIVGAYKTAYYNLGDTVVTLNVLHALVASLAAIICTIGATFFACYKELRAAPAELMRPEAP